jgi:hypothetical protein
MNTRTFSGRLLGGASVLALSSAALIATAGTSSAQTNTISAAIYGGGSTLFSQAARQIFDCYMGTFVAGDTFSFGPTNSLLPGQIPQYCSGRAIKQPVEGLYASVGSGSGTRAFITNSPNLLLQTPNGPPAPFVFPVPNASPPDVDTNNTNAALTSYPYPRVDFGAADSPVAGNERRQPHHDLVRELYSDERLDHGRHRVGRDEPHRRGLQRRCVR